MRVSAVAVVGLLAVTAGCSKTALPETHVPSHTTTTTKMTAAAVPPNARIGALFLGAGDLHTCNASVLDLPGPLVGDEPGSVGRLRNPASRPRWRGHARRHGRRRADDRCRTETGHGCQRHRIRARRRRRPGRLQVDNGTGAGW